MIPFRFSYSLHDILFVYSPIQDKNNWSNIFVVDSTAKRDTHFCIVALNDELSLRPVAVRLSELPKLNDGSSPRVYVKFAQDFLNADDTLWSHL